MIYLGKDPVGVSAGGLVNDVQINGSSVVQDGVANVQIADSSTFGVVKVGTAANGIKLLNTGLLSVEGASKYGEIKPGSDLSKPIVPFSQDYAAFYGLAKVAGADEKNSALPAGQYTENAKSAISQMFNAPVAVSGTTPSFTAMAGVRYVCGEVATLDIAVPASGDVEVIFNSGSTATVLTVTPPIGVTAVKWANGFDSTALDANTRYDIIITDGEWGLAASWA